MSADVSEPLLAGASVPWVGVERGMALGVSPLRFYLAPATGFTASQYLLGRDIGSAPIAGSVRLDPSSRGAWRAFHQGDIIVLTLDKDGNVIGDAFGYPGLSQLVNPLDITQDRRNGNLYVSEYGALRITLLRPG